MVVRAKSISIKELDRVAEVAAKSVAEAKFPGIDIGGIDIGWFPDIGLIGIVAPDQGLRELSAGAMVDLSAKITEASGMLAGGASPAVILGKGHGTMGFFPPDEIIVRFGQ